jgi:hypothetical protein
VGVNCHSIRTSNDVLQNRHGHGIIFFCVGSNNQRGVACLFHEFAIFPDINCTRRNHLALPASKSAIRLFLDLRAQAFLLLLEFGSELRAEVRCLEHRANLNFPLYASWVRAALDPFDRLFQ